MKKNRRKYAKLLGTLLLAAIVAGVGFLPAMTSYAGGGTINVKVNEFKDNDGDLPAGQSFTFRLYRIGGFDGPVFTKDAPFTTSKADVSMPKEENYEGDDWAEKWANAASTLAAEINAGTFGKKDEIALAVKGAKTFSIAAGGSYDVPLPSDGLYLMIGDPIIIDDDLWTPTPTFLGILNGSSLNINPTQIHIKTEHHKVAFEHMVIKNWAISKDDKLTDEELKALEDLEKEMRPSEIKVNISYGDTIIDTVTLNKDNNWTFSWKDVQHENSDGEYQYLVKNSEGKYEEKATFKPVEGAKWNVAEVTQPNATEPSKGPSEDDAQRIRYYKVVTGEGQESDADGIERFNIENTFQPKTLQIKKSLDGYDADGQNVTAVFKITGRNDAGDPIYTTYISVNFGPDDELNKDSDEIKTIPFDVTKIEKTDVEEVYSGNYEPGDIEVEPQLDKDGFLTGWIITASNTHNNNGPKGGVVNQYRHNQTTNQDYGTGGEPKGNSKSE